MQTDDALEKWIMDAVDLESRDKVTAFFRNFCQKNLYKADAKPPQITYTARASNGEIRQYRGIFIEVDESVSFFCCRHIQDEGAISILHAKNDQLKEDMKELVMQFSDGIAPLKFQPRIW